MFPAYSVVCGLWNVQCYSKIQYKCNCSILGASQTAVSLIIMLRPGHMKLNPDRTQCQKMLYVFLEFVWTAPLMIQTSTPAKEGHDQLQNGTVVLLRNT